MQEAAWMLVVIRFIIVEAIVLGLTWLCNTLFGLNIWYWIPGGIVFLVFVLLAIAAIRMKKGFKKHFGDLFEDDFFNDL